MLRKARSYFNSSSFKMALFFTIMLGLTVCILGYFVFYFARDHLIFMTVLSILSIILVSIVILVSFAISIFVVTRTNRIAMAAKEIMETGDLSKRIDVDSKWDDLSYVATVLNSFLARIETLIENIKQVSDNIAHDLRTPLTRLRNDLEKLRDGEPQKSEKYEQVIAESDHVLNIFSALLRISKIESGQGREYFRSIDMSQIIADVKDLYEPLAEEKNITLTMDTQNYMFLGDKDLLFQAIANLFDNAIKFTPNHGKIDVMLSGDGVFSIVDTGMGVAEDEKDKIFRRFYRTENTRTTQGNGLGLSLVEAVVRLHSLNITVENMNPGLKVSIKFE